jgi:UDP-N-acetylmuramoyl-L-alanyl-D-glutamate--2,6-diaminopimelate ligase
MGAIAQTYADAIILTTDNPRSEKATAIIDDIQSGITEKKSCKIVPILDRKEAIDHAYFLSKPGTVIAILGKGRDEYQIIGTQKTYFSDVESVKSL